MDPFEFVQRFGYLAIIVGTFFEGEMITLAAGMAAAAGWLSLPGVIAAGMAGIFVSDTLCFFIGRLAAPRLERWFPRLHARMGKVLKLVERHDEKLIVFFQFVPGLCTVTPMAFGMSRISVGRFMLLDFLGNAVWTLIFSLGGYLFGQAFMHLAEILHAGLAIAMGAVALAAVAYAGWRFRRLLTQKIDS